MGGRSRSGRCLDVNAKANGSAVKAETIVGLQGYIDSFEKLGNGKGGLEWLRPLREAAMARTVDLGFPTARHEDWKYTNLSELAKKPF